MLGYAIAAVFGMLGGILSYEVAKATIAYYKQYGIRKECNIWEDRQFEKECNVAFKNLGRIYHQIEKEHSNEPQQSN